MKNLRAALEAAHAAGADGINFADWWRQWHLTDEQAVDMVVVDHNGNQLLIQSYGDEVATCAYGD